MSIGVDLLKADRIGIRDFKEHLSAKLLNNLLLITDRGNPVSVNLPYRDMLELVDILDEFTDMETLKVIAEGKEAIKTGSEGMHVESQGVSALF